MRARVGTHGDEITDDQMEGLDEAQKAFLKRKVRTPELQPAARDALPVAPSCNQGEALTFPAPMTRLCRRPCSRVETLWRAFRCASRARGLAGVLARSAAAPARITRKSSRRRVRSSPRPCRASASRRAGRAGFAVG